MTPLHLATRHPSPKALALLLKHIGPGEVDTQDKNKVPPERKTGLECVRGSGRLEATKASQGNTQTQSPFCQSPDVFDEDFIFYMFL